jgi:CRISPR type III-A-associated RAMP protein Csm4
VRWKSARFVPLHVAPRLLAYEALKEERWAVDPVSESVLPVEKFGEVSPPFRVAMRRTAAVDRLSGASGDAGSTACLEFAEHAGLWCPVVCPDEWRERVQALFRYIADAGVGGERSSGWGRAAAPEFEPLPSILAGNSLDEVPDQHAAGYWLLSLYAPASSDRVDWNRGSYALLRRSGRTNSAGTPKIESAMVEEGSVVMAELPPAGMAHDVAPSGAGHPVYRAGFAVAIPVAVRLPGFHALERPSDLSMLMIAEDADVAAEPADVITTDIGEALLASENAPEAPPTEPTAEVSGTAEQSDAPAEPAETTDIGEALLASENAPEAPPTEPTAEITGTAEQSDVPAAPAERTDIGEALVARENASDAEPAQSPTDASPQHVEDSPAGAAAEAHGEALLASATDTPEPMPFVAETERPPDAIPAETADGGALEDAAAKPDAGIWSNEPDSEEPR